MAFRVSGLLLWANFRDAAVSYLARHGVFTQESFVVYGKLWGIVIYVLHRDERDAFSDLGWILWKKIKHREFMSQHQAK